MLNVASSGELETLVSVSLLENFDIGFVLLSNAIWDLS